MAYGHRLAVLRQRMVGRLYRALLLCPYPHGQHHGRQPAPVRSTIRHLSAGDRMGHAARVGDSSPDIASLSPWKQHTLRQYRTSRITIRYHRMRSQYRAPRSPTQRPVASYQNAP
eukprot:1478155-Rhodomonas_salina.1